MSIYLKKILQINSDAITKLMTTVIIFTKFVLPKLLNKYGKFGHYNTATKPVRDVFGGMTLQF